MPELTPEILRRGSLSAPTQRFELRAGPLSLLFDSAGIRRLRLGGFEVLRRVYFAVRDRDWGTVPNVVTRIERHVESDRFDLEFDVVCRQEEIDFAWTGRLTGRPDGSTEFSAECEARSGFLSNRIGFCVLHPVAECACRACTVEHKDGASEGSSFPFYVSPHQPFRDMRSISYDVTPELWAEVRFEGETFEMEDQRNWTDASYKTYSRPLALPYPFQVVPGQRFAQAVRLKFNGAPSPPSELSTRPVLTLHRKARGTLPEIGLGTASHGTELSEGVIARLGLLPLSHIRVDVDPGRHDARAALARAAREAAALGCAIELAVFISDAGALQELGPIVGGLEAPVAACVICHADGPGAAPAAIPEARRVLQDSCPDARFGVGSNANFAELNRDRPETGGLDFVSFAANPQVHAFDDLSIMETPEGLGWTVRSARQFAGDAGVRVSPLTLRPRVNAVATPEEGSEPDALPPQVDPRQMSLFAAAWTVCCLRALAERGAEAVTVFETTGWRGIMETEAGASIPGLFPSLPGCVFPVYHVLAALEGFAGAEALGIESCLPLRVQGLALRRSGRIRALVANITNERTTAELRGLTAPAKAKVLDERNAERAMREPEAFIAEKGEELHCLGGRLQLDLPPYAVAIIAMDEDADA